MDWIRVRDARRRQVPLFADNGHYEVLNLRTFGPRAFQIWALILHLIELARTRTSEEVVQFTEQAEAFLIQQLRKF